MGAELPRNPTALLRRHHIFYSETVIVGHQVDASGPMKGSLELRANGTGEMSGQIFQGTAQIRRESRGRYKWKGLLRGEDEDDEEERELTISMGLSYGSLNGVRLPPSGARLAIIHVDGMP